MKLLGVDSKYVFQDLWSLEKENIGFFPQPVVSVILLFRLPSEKVRKITYKETMFMLTKR